MNIIGPARTRPKRTAVAMSSAASGSNDWQNDWRTAGWNGTIEEGEVLHRF